jgi:hypothetical protein
VGNIGGKVIHGRLPMSDRRLPCDLRLPRGDGIPGRGSPPPAASARIAAQMVVSRMTWPPMPLLGTPRSKASSDAAPPRSGAGDCRRR